MGKRYTLDQVRTINRAAIYYAPPTKNKTRELCPVCSSRMTLTHRTLVDEYGTQTRVGALLVCPRGCYGYSPHDSEIDGLLDEI